MLFRTLINQLVSSILWYCILWTVIQQIPTIIRFSTNVPFPHFICSADLIIRNALSMQVWWKLFFYFIFFCKKQLQIDTCGQKWNIKAVNNTNLTVMLTFSFQILLLLDFIIIVKYAFIFKFKNPTALQVQSYLFVC